MPTTSSQPNLNDQIDETQAAKAEKAKLQAQISKALRMGYIERNTKCQICLVYMLPDQLNQHVCMQRAIILCEYCPQASSTFKSTKDLYDHLSNGIHSNMTLKKCSKCSIGFPAQILTKFHQMSKQTHLGAPPKKCESCARNKIKKSNLLSFKL